MLKLSPSQLAGLKLARAGDLFPQPDGKWTHENATITYAKNDRWKERPQKIKFVTAKILFDLCRNGFIERRNLTTDDITDSYGISMAGKIWLLQNK